MFSKLKLITGNANIPLAEEVARFAGIPLGDIELFKFSNDESFVKINDNVRGADVFIIQPTCYPVNDSLMDLLIVIDALKRASAQRISCVIPYYAYARSDKKDQPRVPITAKLVADLITIAGANRVITVDLHAEQIQGFFNIPVDHLFTVPIFARYFKSIMNLDDVVVVSPDSGGANRARALAKRLNSGLAIADKRRSGNNDKTECMNIIGDVQGKNAILFDDIIDTGGSLIKVALELQKKGAKHVYAACAHGVLSGNAVENLENSPIEKLYITNTIPLTENKKSEKIVQLSIAEMLAIAIKKIHIEESISILFR
ncbi:MAG: ribose-phosphate pyrophosphokinase [Candidatus Cloacimonetes bacterium HGW-Cloacimonetes-1]|jgi:ribose-phosphate pyrophosphokinase|nr:MAG: ribose-phosphate pyrophosphokinase [Candidatus Cloacimonetes bacterium HGW-Cloacimonetes-1]